MRSLWLLFSQAVTVVLAAVFVLATLKPAWLGARPGPGPLNLPAPTVQIVPPAPRASDVMPWSGVSLAAERASPAVVSVVTTQVLAEDPHADIPLLRFRDRDGRAPTRSGLGSGVIVAPEGYLLTNHHVVADAEQIEVRLADGRSAEAQVVGSDPDTDLALIKIDLPELPVVVFGDQSVLRVGDVVVAIGNPFNVGQTVTAGIVSALGRNRLGLSTFENFIQTDAAINPGNSGGALVDAEGRLVGINTAIFSRSGGSMGIGFAIPADTARHVLESLAREGRVRRGWLGVELGDLTPEFARSFSLPIREGALVTGVLRDGPASRGGLRPGDVIVAVGDTPVAGTDQLLSAIAALAPGTDAVIAVQRGEQRLPLEITVGERPALSQLQGR